MKWRDTGRLITCLMVLLLSACEMETSQRVAHGRGVRSAVEVALPPGLEAGQIMPLDGEQATMGDMTLRQIIESNDSPDYLTGAIGVGEYADDPDTADASVVPPPAAQRAYVAGRQSWRDGKNFEAVRQLQVALRLAPGSPEILRLLGRIYTNAGNKVRGAVYLKQAVHLDPTDMESLLLLGRFSIEQGDWVNAIATFHAALERISDHPDIAEPAYRPLSHYYLAVALQQGGYVRAAIEHFDRYLNTPRTFSFSTRISRELMFIDRRQSFVWQSIGDLYHQLNDPASAMAAYQQAVEQAEGIEDISLLNRRIYTCLRLGLDEQAQRLVIDRFGRMHGDRQSMLALVRYLIEQGRPTHYMIDTLMHVYTADPDSPSLAMVLADLMPSHEGRILLMKHLQAFPRHRQVYDHLIRRYLLPEGAEAFDREVVEQAVAVTSELMAGDAEHASEYAAILLDRMEDRKLLLEVLDRFRREQSGVIASVLYGLVLIEDEQPDDAAVVFETVLQSHPDLLPARVGLAKIMVMQQDYERASRILEPLSGSRDRNVIELRVRVLSATGQFAQALELLDGIVDMDNSPTRLIIQKARLHLQLGESAQAERVLIEGLERHPLDEALYAALFEFYDSNQAGPDAVRQYQRLMQQVLNLIPRSRIARLKLAEVHQVQSQFEKAEAILLELLAEDEKDVPVLAQLLDVYRGLKNREKELEITEKLLLLEEPTARRSWGLSMIYRETGRLEKAAEVLKEALSGEEFVVQDPTLLVRMYWLVMLDRDRGDQAEQAMQQFIDRYPEYAAELWYELAILIERRGDKARSEQTLIELLQRYPDNPLANNNLGYSWTVQHKNLDQALEMIQKAVDEEPHNSAYLDSLGWVYYKLGRFEDAEVRLQQSRNENGGEYPVILDHLGDTLYRLDRPDDAKRVWEKALSLFEEALPDDDPDLIGLDDRLKAKLESLEAGLPVPVAEVAVELDSEAANGEDNDERENVQIPEEQAVEQAPES